jgi:hypothetical protein
VWGWLAVLIGVAAVILAWLVYDLRRQRQYASELRGRVAVSDADLFRLHFVASNVTPDVPGRVRRVFAAQMGYPVEKPLPDDNFAFFWNELDAAPSRSLSALPVGIALTWGYWSQRIDTMAEGGPHVHAGLFERHGGCRSSSWTG